MTSKQAATTSPSHELGEGVELADLADKFGTPLFVFSETRLRQNYRSIHDAFHKTYPNVIVAYSIKTNYNLAICNIMRQEGAYAAVGSGLDLHVAHKVGFPPEHVIYDGLHKTEEELRIALKKKVRIINVESFSELTRLNKLAGELHVTQDIGIRINITKKEWFPREVFNGEAIHGYPASRFGFALQDVMTAFRHAAKLDHLNVVGIMAHPYNVAMEMLLPFVNRIKQQLGIHIQHLNVGGGFSKNRQTLHLSDLAKDLIREKFGFESKLDKPRRNTNLDAVANTMTAAVKNTLKDTPQIVLEPGRYIVSDAGQLLLRVGCVKEASGCTWAVVDGGTNLVPDFWERRDIQVLGKAEAPSTEIVNVVGPLLYIDDFIAIKSRLPKVQEGDILAVSNVGEYSLSQFNQFLYPRPAAVLVGSNGKATLIREKETYEDVVHKDKIV